MKNLNIFKSVEFYSLICVTIIFIILNLFFTQQTVEKYMLDFMILIIFLVISFALFIIGKKSKHIILLRLLSLFVFFHFIFFPFIYVYLLNSNTNNLRIEKDVFNAEKVNEVLEINKIYGESNLSKQRILNDIITTEKSFLKYSVDSIKLNQMFQLKNYIIVSNYSIPKVSGGNRPPNPIETLHFYDKIGNYKLQIEIDEDLKNIEQLLFSAIKKFNNLQNLKNKEIENINIDKFWSYKNVLPYSINIFITSNFVPKTKTANVVYFMHNFFVFGIILSLIFGFIQNYYSSSNQE